MFNLKNIFKKELHNPFEQIYRPGDLVVLNHKEMLSDNGWTNVRLVDETLHGIVTGISPYHIPDKKSVYVVMAVYKERGINQQLGVGNKDRGLRKANFIELKDLSKFPSLEEISKYWKIEEITDEQIRRFINMTKCKSHDLRVITGNVDEYVECQKCGKIYSSSAPEIAGIDFKNKIFKPREYSIRQ